MYSESKNVHAKNTVAWQPMSDDWKERCRSNSFWFQDTVAEAKKMFPAMDERMFELKARLLDFAGEAVYLPECEEDMENILEYGQFWLGYVCRENLASVTKILLFCGEKTVILPTSAPDMHCQKMGCGDSIAGWYTGSRGLIRLLKQQCREFCITVLR